MNVRGIKGKEKFPPHAARKALRGGAVYHRVRFVHSLVNSIPQFHAAPTRIFYTPRSAAPGVSMLSPTCGAALSSASQRCLDRYIVCSARRAILTQPLGRGSASML